MRYGPLTLTLAVALAAGPLAASAQPYPTSPQNDEAYQQNQSQYQDNNAAYQAQQQQYQDQRADYDQQRSDYQAQREAYERARADYDAQWGVGAYERRYGPFRGYSTEYNGYAVYRDSPCEHRRNDAATAGTVIGALAGAAIGSNLAAHAGGRLGGAILGGVVGGVAGNSIGRHTASCDASGYYYSYDATVPYAEDEAYADRQSGEHDYRWYRDHRCRLAVAPVERDDGTMDDRYVRVCPDSDGRYRFAR